MVDSEKSIIRCAGSSTICSKSKCKSCPQLDAWGRAFHVFHQPESNGFDELLDLKTLLFGALQRATARLFELPLFCLSLLPVGLFHDLFECFHSRMRTGHELFEQSSKKRQDLGHRGEI